MRDFSNNGGKGVKKDKKSRKSGFTLIELLTVVTIMLVVAGLVVGVASVAKRKARVSRTKAHLQQVHVAIQEYQLATSVFPDNLGDIVGRLPQTVMINTNASPHVPMDAWGRDFVYEKRNEGAYTVYSQGAKESITADDIYSGK